VSSTSTQIDGPVNVLRGVIAQRGTMTPTERLLLEQAEHFESLLMQAEAQLRRAGIIPVYRPKHTLLTLRHDN
jgi:hypothetical protein